MSCVRLRPQLGARSWGLRGPCGALLATARTEGGEGQEESGMFTAPGRRRATLHQI